MIKPCIKIFVFTKNQIHTALKQTYKLIMKNSITFMPKLASNTKFENYYRLMYCRKTKFQVFSILRRQLSHRSLDNDIFECKTSNLILLS